MTRKIAIVGPESSGKSSLAQEMASHYKVPLVDEYARVYLENLQRGYTQGDLLEIAKGQIDLEDEVLKSNPLMIICDTNLLVIKIWSIYKYGNCENIILNLIKERQYDLQLLLRPDVPWEPDRQSENPQDWNELCDLYYKDLQLSGERFELIEGTGTNRLRSAIQSIHEFGID